jgi:hypothetical protein
MANSDTFSSHPFQSGQFLAEAFGSPLPHLPPTDPLRPRYPPVLLRAFPLVPPRPQRPAVPIPPLPIPSALAPHRRPSQPPLHRRERRLGQPRQRSGQRGVRPRVQRSLGREELYRLLGLLPGGVPLDPRRQGLLRLGPQGVKGVTGGGGPRPVSRSPRPLRFGRRHLGAPRPPLGTPQATAAFAQHGKWSRRSATGARPRGDRCRFQSATPWPRPRPASRTTWPPMGPAAPLFCPGLSA